MSSQPFAPPTRSGPGMPPLFKGIVVALVAVAIAATVVLLAPIAGRPPGEEAEASRAAAAHALGRGSRGLRWATGAAATSSPGSFSPTPLEAPLDPALLDCQARLRRSHEELVDLEADLARWDDDFRFSLGEANPGAEQALAPLVVPLLTDPRWRLLEHSFRCRTWACRLIVRFDQPHPNSAFWSAWRLRQKVVNNAAITARVRVSDAQGPLEEAEDSFVYLVPLQLRQPSGAPRPGPPLAPPMRALQLPPTATGCEAAATAAARELPDRRERWSKAEPVDQRFERSQEPPDLELARAVEARQPWFTNLLATTECRGRVCRQTNRYHLLGRTFWSKPMGRDGRRTVFDEGTESFIYEEVGR
jgi:hypothetical protein